MKNIFNNLLNKYSRWGILYFILSGLIVAGIAAVVCLIFIPVDMQILDTTNVCAELTYSNEAVIDNDINYKQIAAAVRAGLFKSASAIKSRPMADKTIAKIKSQLKLQCIMNIKGRQVAYIKVKGMGLKKCVPGDSVEDMFSVLDVSKDAVAISIIGHKVVLKL